MTAGKDLAALVGRILLGIVFIPAGFGKIGGFTGLMAMLEVAGYSLPSGLREKPAAKPALNLTSSYRPP